MKCLLCGKGDFRPYYYPPTYFNKKTFRYFECLSCSASQIDPLPDQNDLDIVYGLNDHSYLLDLKEGETLKYKTIYPKFHYQLYQLNFLEKYDYIKYGSNLLDVGCGSGFYMHYAQTLGFNCVGVEFNDTFSKVLREKTHLPIFSFEELEKQPELNKRFDVIHLGHVLEHSTAPGLFIENLKKYAHSETVFIIDGPLEANTCLSQFIIKAGSKIKHKEKNYYAPQHITFTNYKSQLEFFKTMGFKKINYEVCEQSFPLPSEFNLARPLQSVLFIVSRMSIYFSKLHPKFGNVFHFGGKLNPNS